jgi:hypothetical protein
MAKVVLQEVEEADGCISFFWEPLVKFTLEHILKSNYQDIRVATG